MADARPSRDHLRSTFALAAAFWLAFYIVYGGASWITGLHGWRWHVDFPFESRLPFYPAAAVAYLSLVLVLACTPWILRTWRETVPLALTLFAETLAGGVCFLLFPIETGFPERAATGPFAGVFRLADVLNLERNNVPSLHVAFSLTAALAFARGRGRLAHFLWLIWATGVAASTVLMHEHHLVDVATGAILAVVALRVVHRRCRSDAFLETLRIEWICLLEFLRLARRHLRYAGLALVIYRYSLPRWRQTRTLRAAYCLAQHVDDVLDGDVAVADPEAWLDRILGLMRDGGQPATPIDVLALFVAVAEPRAELLELFETLRRDRRRIDGRLLWSAGELAEHHRKTFRLSLDVTLELLGSRLRARDARPLVDALAWCSPHRDLEEDLARGLINVPREVVERSRTGRPEAVSAWIREEFARGQAALAASRRLLAELDPDDPGSRAIALFTTAIERYARRYERTLGDRRWDVPLDLPEPTPCRSAA